MSMTSNRPYLLRALHEWILDNGMTPYVVIDADMPNVNVPERYVEDGKIVLNLSKTAALNMKIENEVMRFTTSFFRGFMHCIRPSDRCSSHLFQRKWTRHDFS